MNLWGVGIVIVGFLLLYVGFKNENPASIVKAFAPQGSVNAKTSSSTTSTNNAKGPIMGSTSTGGSVFF